MKKAIFFLLLVFFPSIVNASSYLTNFEVLNGTLSIPFSEKNNIYTIYLNEVANSVDYEYTAEKPNSEIEVIDNEWVLGEENIMILKVRDIETNEIETYTFYLEKEVSTPVSLELSNPSNVETTKEIPHLKEIVIGVCILCIFILFKLLILNFWKKKKEQE